MRQEIWWLARYDLQVLVIGSNLFSDDSIYLLVSEATRQISRQYRRGPCVHFLQKFLQWIGVIRWVQQRLPDSCSCMPFCCVLGTSGLAYCRGNAVPLSMSYSRNKGGSLMYVYICTNILASPIDHKETSQLPPFQGWNKIVPRRSKVCWTMHFDHVGSCLHWKQLVCFQICLYSLQPRTR